MAFLVVLNLLKHGKPFMVFDWKRNYRDLLSLEAGQDILVFTVGRSCLAVLLQSSDPASRDSPYNLAQEDYRDSPARIFSWERE